MQNNKLENLIEFRNPGNTAEIMHNSGRFGKVFISRYKYYIKYFKNVYFYTFDKKNIESFEINTDIKNNLYFNRYNLNPIIYAFLTPLLHYKMLKKAKYFFGIQVPNSLYPIYNSFFFKNKKVIIYWNFDWIYFAENLKKSKLYILFVKIWTFLTLKLCNNYIVTNSADKKNILKHRPSANVLVLPTAIDNEIFRPLTYIKRKKNTLLFVGRLTYQKNLENLIRAVAEIENIELHIAGDGELKGKLYKLACELNSRIIFHGNKKQNEIVELLNEYSLFILPSFTEGISNALVEAMACKIPIIASNIYTTAEIIKHEYNGLLCETDKDSIKEKIIFAINNYDIMFKYAENAYNMVLKDFLAENYFKKVSEFVKTL